MRELLTDCERVAHDQGLAAGLAVALAGIDLAAPPGRIAAIPTAQAGTNAPVVQHTMAGTEGISFVLCDRASDPATPEFTAFAARLGAVRLGITRRLLAFAITHLSGRVASGEPTIRKQLVLGVIADVQTAIEAARQALLVAGTVPAAVVDVHDRLTKLDWEAAKLLGASGYVAGSPATTAYVSRLVANCWIVREGT